MVELYQQHGALTRRLRKDSFHKGTRKPSLEELESSSGKHIEAVGTASQEQAS